MNSLVALSLFFAFSAGLPAQHGNVTVATNGSMGVLLNDNTKPTLLAKALDAAGLTFEPAILTGNH